MKALFEIDCMDCGGDKIRRVLLEKYEDLSLVIRLGEKGSRLLNKDTDIYMPPITEFNHQILMENYVNDTSL